MHKNDKIQPEGGGTTAAEEQTAPGGGKALSEFMPTSLRNVTRTSLEALKSVADSPLDARIYRETSGNGYEYYTLKYRQTDKNTGRRTLVSRYLGRPEDDILEMMHAIVAEKHKLLPARVELLDFDTDNIRKLKKLFRTAKDAAREIARDTKFRFHGHWLRRRT